MNQGSLLSLRLAFFYSEVPNTKTSGSSFVIFSIIKALSALGYKITVFSLMDEKLMEQSHIHIKLLEDKNINVKKVSYVTKHPKHIPFLKRYWRLVFPRYDDYDFVFNTNVARLSFEAVLNTKDFDVLIPFDNTFIKALSNISSIKKIGILGDPYSLVWYHRFQLFPFELSLTYLKLFLNYVSFPRNFLSWLSNACKDYDQLFSFSYLETELFKKSGLKRVTSLPMATVDLAPPHIIETKIKLLSEKPKIKCVMLGSIAQNYDGIRIIKDFLIPSLKKNNISNIEIHLIGGSKGDHPPDIKRVLDSKEVILRGFVEDIESDLVDTDIIFYPSDYPVGARSKLVFASSFGCVIVTHKSSLHGIPELKSGINCLLGNSPEELSDHVINLSQNRVELTKLQAGSRKLYETYYQPEIAIKPFQSALDQIFN